MPVSLTVRRGFSTVVAICTLLLLSAGESAEESLQLDIAANVTDTAARWIYTIHCRSFGDGRPQSDFRGESYRDISIGYMDEQLDSYLLTFRLNDSIIYPNTSLLRNFSVRASEDDVFGVSASFQLDPYNLFFGNFTCAGNGTSSNDVLLAYLPQTIEVDGMDNDVNPVAIVIPLSIVLLVTLLLVGLLVACACAPRACQTAKTSWRNDEEFSSFPPASQHSKRSKISSAPFQFTGNGYIVPNCSLAPLTARARETEKQGGYSTAPNLISKRVISKVLKYLLHPPDCSSTNCLCKEVKKEYNALLNERYSDDHDCNQSQAEPSLTPAPLECHVVLEEGQTLAEEDHDQMHSGIMTVEEGHCKDGDTIRYPTLAPPSPGPGLELSYVDPVERVMFDSKGGRYFNQDHGIGLKVPPGAIPENDQITIEIGVSLTCPIPFPADTKPISPMVFMCVVDKPNYQFQKPVEVRLAHCLDIMTQEEVANLKLKFLKSGHNLFCFHAAEGESTFESGTQYGCLKTTHFCCFCLAADARKADATKTFYRLIKVAPKPTTSLRWKARYCITYFLPTCLQALEKQYCHRDHDIQSLQRFKFVNPATSDQPYIGISFERRVVGGWNLALESADRIYAKDIDFWEIESSHLKQMEIEQLYPPRFVIDVCGTQAHSNGQVWINFSGMTNEFKSELILDANREPDVAHYNFPPFPCGRPFQNSFSDSNIARRYPSLYLGPHGHIQLPTFTPPWIDTPRAQDSCSGSTSSLDSYGNPLPSDHDLMNKVAAMIPTKWRHVGIQLGMENAHLDVIKQRCSNDSLLCFGEVFTEWKRRMTTPFSWSTIIDALKSPLVGENMLAHKLQNEFGSSSFNSTEGTLQSTQE